MIACGGAGLCARLSVGGQGRPPHQQIGQPGETVATFSSLQASTNADSRQGLLIFSFSPFRLFDFSPSFFPFYPFVFQKPALMFQAGAESPQRAVRRYYPVAGDEDGDGVSATGLAHGPGGLGAADFPGQLRVG